jgi:predicted DNA-binding protein
MKGRKRRRLSERKPVRLTIRLPTWLDERLETLAQTEQRNPSDLIERLINAVVTDGIEFKLQAHAVQSRTIRFSTSADEELKRLATLHGWTSNKLIEVLLLLELSKREVRGNAP